MARDDTADTVVDDAELQLKKRARRRLVGSIALVLTAVVILPMVMDHEPRPNSNEIQVRIPSQDGAATNAKAAKAPEIAEPVSEKVADKAPPPAAVAPTPSVPVAQAVPAKPPVVDAPKPEPAAKVEPPTAEPPKAEPPKAAVKPEPPKAEKADKADSAKAAAALAGKEAAAEKKGEQWVVQLGAYSEAGRVKLLQTKLKEVGVPSYTEKVDTPQGPRTRVRAGPFPSKDAATKAQARIKIVGVDGPVAPK